MAVNLLAVLVAVVLSMAVGAVWYSPLAFAKPWMRLVGLTDKDLKKDGAWVNYLITFIGLVLMALVLSLFLNLLGVSNVVEGLKVGFFVWSGFVATTSLTNALFSQKPLKLYLLENGHHLAVILVMSAILSAWR